MESAYWSPSNDSVVSNEDSTSRTFHRTTSAQVSAAMLPTLGKPFWPVHCCWEKKSSPLLNFVICVYVLVKSTYNISLTCAELDRISGKKLGNFLEVRSLFGPFCTKSAKIRPQLCPAALFFIRPFLSYAAEQSASWEHLSAAAGFTSGTGIQCSGITIRTPGTLDAKRNLHSLSLIFGFLRW